MCTVLEQFQHFLKKTFNTFVCFVTYSISDTFFVVLKLKKNSKYCKLCCITYESKCQLVLLNDEKLDKECHEMNLILTL